ncbi:MAG: methionine gamma-lyase family protein [Firmicutes bacterium]|nr:methionine gamma-lyase family protein [Bacillota bacterium]
MGREDIVDSIIKNARAAMEEQADKLEKICEENFYRVLNAFREEKVSAQHFRTTTGYGYNDMGRDKLEQVYARVFGAEAALVRQNIVSGSHAIALALAGNLLPGDQLLSLGMPYDTLQTVMGINRPTPGSLREYGVECTIYDMDFARPNLEEIKAQLTERTKMVALQRSRGYSTRPSLSVKTIVEICDAVKSVRPDVIFFVDNCYGEFVETTEPSMFSVDLMAGSLIKNPGAGIAPGGGYIVGRAEYVERAAVRLTVPGAGSELGPTLSDPRPYYQSLYLAPQIVMEALLGAIFTAAVLEQMGFSVSPGSREARADIIQTVNLSTPERLIAFCQGIQKYSPVDSFVQPLPWPMPGYDNDIIMASGSFVDGSSIELSADAPLREPYSVFMQGGLSRWHTVYALQNTLQDMKEQGLL